MNIITTYVVTVTPGGTPQFHRLELDGSPIPMPSVHLPPRVRLCGLSLQAWASGLPLPLGSSSSVAPSLLGVLPRSAPLRVAVVVEEAPLPVLH